MTLCSICITIFFSCNSSNLPKDFSPKNAIWTEAIYLKGFRPSTNEKLTDSLIESYCNNLKNFNVEYAYLFAGPYSEDGHLPAYPFSAEARSTVAKMKKFYPEIKILPWIGGIQNKTVYLNDPIWVKNAVIDTQRLIDSLKCDGVHVDLEFILKDDAYLYSMLKEKKLYDIESYGTNVNNFHKKLRQAMPNTLISSVVTSTSNNVISWKRKTSMNELKELVLYIDQINFLFYDTHIEDQGIFIRSCLEQLETIKQLKRLNPSLQCLLSIGTFINEPKLQIYRNMKIENISNTLETIRSGLAKFNDNPVFLDGISIFCDWETDKNEWNEFYNGWGKYGTENSVRKTSN